jgi:hypothetical protein
VTNEKAQQGDFLIQQSFVLCEGELLPDLSIADFRHQLFGSSPAADAAFSTWAYSSSARRKVMLRVPSKTLASRTLASAPIF